MVATGAQCRVLAAPAGDLQRTQARKREDLIDFAPYQAQPIA